MCVDVYEESEADLWSERNNNDWYRSTKSRSPDATFGKGTKTDIRKLSSGYFVCVWKQSFSFIFAFIFVKCTRKMYMLASKKKILFDFVWFFQNSHSFVIFIFQFIFCTFILTLFLPPIVNLLFRFCFVILQPYFSIFKYFCFVLFYFLYCTHKMGECGMLPNHFVFLLFVWFLLSLYSLVCMMFMALCTYTQHTWFWSFKPKTKNTQTHTINTYAIDGSTNSDWYVEATGRRRSSGKWRIKIFKWNLGKICKLLLSSLLA